MHADIGSTPWKILYNIQADRVILKDGDKFSGLQRRVLFTVMVIYVYEFEFS